MWIDLNSLNFLWQILSWDKVQYLLLFLISIAIWELIKKGSKSAVSYVISKSSGKTALIIVALLLSLLFIVWFKW